MNSNFKKIEELKQLLKDLECKEKVEKFKCLHKLCPECKGTGVRKSDGTPCIHMISCTCPRCSPSY